MSQEHEGSTMMWDLVGTLGRQLRESWSAGADLGGIRGRRSVIVCGMGGSAAAADLLGSVLDPAEVEVRVHRGYGFRGQVPADSLLVFSSYSGNTEETLSAWADALEQYPVLPRVVIGSGGRLADLARAEGVPRVQLPGGLPPRASIGHGVGALAAVLSRATPTRIGEQVDDAVVALEAGNRRWGLGEDAATDVGLAGLASALRGRWPVLYTGSSLTHAVARRWRAQLNENSKLLATTAELPELDHNEVVGWGQETPARAVAAVVALRDPGEHPRVARRFEATRKVLGGAVDQWHERQAPPGPPLARMMSLVQEGDVLSCMLARQAGVDPVPVECIDRLKDMLAGD